MTHSSRRVQKHLRTIQSFIRREVKIWYHSALPGILVIALIIFLRLTGSLQFLEQNAFDYVLQLRPAEPTDPRILVVGIDEADIQAIGTYPIADQTLATLLQALQQHQPGVIGLDILRPTGIAPGESAFAAILHDSPNLIGIEAAFPLSGRLIPPPSALPAARVGFADAVLDSDGNLRRSLLGAWNLEQTTYKQSFTLKVAAAYLAKQGIPLENGRVDQEAIRFGAIELPRIHPHTGGYVNVDAAGNQVFIHFRSGKMPFRQVSLQDVLADRVPVDWIQDRIVLIGVTAPSVKDLFRTTPIGKEMGLVAGIVIQAHAISQILSAVLDGRSLLQSWIEIWDYLWIVGWGILGISLGRIFLRPSRITVALLAASGLLILICITWLWTGWWLPLVPAMLVLVLNGAGLSAAIFYRHQQDLEQRLREREYIIEYTYDAIHNGPLQTLARLLRQLQDQTVSTPEIYPALQQLNRELRTVYETVRQETLTANTTLHLVAGAALDLQSPLQELLYEVFHHTLSRNFPGFQSIRLKIPVFESLQDNVLTTEQKRGLCLFMEESLCNVGKHAVNATRLEVRCKQEQNHNLICIIDNGDLTYLKRGDRPIRGRGTEQAKMLANQLGGTFERYKNHPQGIVCELRWPIAPSSRR